MVPAGRMGALIVVAVAGVVLVARPVAAVDPLNPAAPCSVFDDAPCAPLSICGVFDPWPCVPRLPSIGEGLQLTASSRSTPDGRAPEGSINSIRDLIAALRACWEPPPLSQAFHGMQMSVRFSFKRTGELVAAPRVTFTTSGADPKTKQIYRAAIDAALARCTPMPFSRTMGGAIAGRPISIRYVDDRDNDG